MRLIDGDALEKSLEKLWNVHDDQDFANKDVWREIENAPTIEPERKKGKWIPVINGRGGNECNQCHEYAPSYVSGNEYLSDFCPRCGADMRGE